MAIIFNDGSGNPLVQTVGKLSSYLSQAQLKLGGTLSSNNSQYILFGQKGNKTFDPNNPQNYSSYMTLQILNSNDSIESQLLLNKNNPNTSGNTGLNQNTYMATRGNMENILSNYKLLFMYDFFDSDAVGLTVTNKFDSPLEDTINQVLSNPIMQAVGEIGGASGTVSKLLNPVAGLMGMTGGDLFSMIFLSKVKTVKMWQGGDITFDLPVSLTFLDYDNDPLNNVMLPVYLLYLIQGYHRIPFAILNNNTNKWVEQINSLITLTIGPMYFTLGLGNFLGTDKYNMLAIESMDVKFSSLIDGIPTVAKVDLKISNINPIVLEDVPPIGDSSQGINLNISSSTNIIQPPVVSKNNFKIQ